MRNPSDSRSSGKKMDSYVTREEALCRLTEFLENRLTKHEIYNWALKLVYDKRYESLDEQDKLLSDVIHALFCLHHEGNEIQFDPSRTELLRYKKLLEAGKERPRGTKDLGRVGG